jgi:hypothetical protein
VSDDGQTIELKTEGLDKLLKALKKKPPFAQVGVLGDKNARSGPVNSNATVGAAHEFGTTKSSQRSFLRIPITDNLQRYMERAGEPFWKAALKDILKQGSLFEWAKKLGLIGETIVGDAFDSGGFGKWKPSNMDKKKVQQTLVETQQLRNSITSRVVE